MADFGDISGLSTLLDESRQAQNEPATYSQPPVAATPSNIVVGSKAQSTKNGPVPPVKSGDIWRPEEILPEDTVTDWKDDRPCPRYEISYKQAVGTEDTFLGMSEKTPLTSDCTHLVIKIIFPKSTMKDLDLDVTKNRIRASSKTHCLFTYLPVTVEENGSAKFDSKKEMLTVTLKIVSDYE